MDERGLFSVLALWFTITAVAIGLALLDVGQTEIKLTSERSFTTHALYAATTVAVLAYSSGFAEASLERVIDGCTVRAARRFEDQGLSAVLTCDVSSGRLHKTYDIGWRRIGADWRPVWWNER